MPITDAGTVLLIRQFRQAAGKVLLEASAGTIEPGEAPEVTALRELREEVGQRARKLFLVGGSWVAPGYSTEYSYMFIASELEVAPLPSDDGEDISVEEIEFDDLHRLIAEGEIEDQMSIAALLSAQHVYTKHIKGSENE